MIVRAKKIRRGEEEKKGEEGGGQGRGRGN
jgi:hypothetical protein